MVQRQRRDHHFLTFAQQRLSVATELAQAGTGLLHVGDQVAVGQHRALGQARGAAGVLQHRDVIEADLERLDALPAAHAQGTFEGDRLGQLIGRDHLLDLVHQGIDQPALGGGHQVAHLRFDQVLDLGVGQHLLDFLPEHVQVHQRPGTGVLELVAHLARGIQRVGVDHDQAGAQGTKHSNRVMQDVGHLHRDAIAGHQVSLALQEAGERRTVAFEVSVGQGHAHVAERGTVGEFLAGTFEHLDHRLIGTQINIIGYAGRAFIIPEISLHYYCPLYLSQSGPPERSFWDTSSYGESGKYQHQRH